MNLMILFDDIRNRWILIPDVDSNLDYTKNDWEGIYTDIVQT